MQRERIPLIVTNVFLILFIVAAALTHIQCVFEVRVENPKTGDFVIVSAGLWKMCTAAKNSTTSESSCAKLSDASSPRSWRNYVSKNHYKNFRNNNLAGAVMFILAAVVALVLVIFVFLELGNCIDVTDCWAKTVNITLASLIAVVLMLIGVILVSDCYVATVSLLNQDRHMFEKPPSTYLVIRDQIEAAVEVFEFEDWYNGPDQKVRADLSWNFMMVWVAFSFSAVAFLLLLIYSCCCAIPTDKSTEQNEIYQSLIKENRHVSKSSTRKAVRSDSDERISHAESQYRNSHDDMSNYKKLHDDKSDYGKLHGETSHGKDSQRRNSYDDKTDDAKPSDDKTKTKLTYEKKSKLGKSLTSNTVVGTRNSSEGSNSLTSKSMVQSSNSTESSSQKINSD